eukprot:scaffold2.g7221.t1
MALTAAISTTARPASCACLPAGRAALPSVAAAVPAFRRAAPGGAARTRLGAAARPARRQQRRALCVAASVVCPIRALIWDCDGVIVESEEIHRQAYNAAFRHFDVRCPGDDAPVEWSVPFYDDLQNRVGGGKPKMRWYFGQRGWPATSVLGGRAPEGEGEQALVIDTLQDWKTEKYKDIVGSGEVSARPGVVRLMEEAQAAGVPVAVCSAATKAAVEYVLASMLGAERFAGLDLFMAGDDVPAKKPDPMIYKARAREGGGGVLEGEGGVAAQRLGVNPSDCLVVEDSTIGLAAARGAGMRCAITFTHSTARQEFEGAECVLASLDGVRFADLAAGALAGRDDRAAVTAATICWSFCGEGKSSRQMPSGKTKRTGSSRNGKNAVNKRVWEDVRKEGVHDGKHGPMGTLARVELDEDVPGHGRHFCVTCSRYFVTAAAQTAHERTKEHKRRIKELMGARPHNQADADWAAGMGAPDNGPSGAGGSAAAMEG